MRNLPFSLNADYIEAFLDLPLQPQSVPQSLLAENDRVRFSMPRPAKTAAPSTTKVQIAASLFLVIGLLQAWLNEHRDW